MEKELTTYSKMVNTGVGLVRENGLEGFNIRTLCNKAKVNLGMFHYYFKNKDNFNAVIIETLSCELIKKIRVDISLENTPEENIAYILKHLSCFITSNRVLCASLVKDMLSGNQKVQQMFVEKMLEPAKIILKALDRGKRLGNVVKGDNLNLFFAVFMPVIMPQIVQCFMVKPSSKLKGEVFNENTQINIDELIKISIQSVFKDKICEENF